METQKQHFDAVRVFFNVICFLTVRCHLGWNEYMENFIPANWPACDKRDISKTG
jgi:hypothetical protein